MTYLYELTALFFSIWLVRNILFWLALWQLKEYRFDRVFVHLFETIQGKNILFGNEKILKLAFITGFFINLLWYSSSPLLSLFTFFLYTFDGIFSIKEIINRKFKRPKITPKIISMFLLTLIFCFTFLIFPLLNKFFWLFLLDALLPIWIALLVFIHSLPSEFYKDIMLHRASIKINSLPKLLRIGITGSYGKGSTKECLFFILSTYLNAVKTPGSNNTEIGIARTILHKVKPSTSIFLAEMGAYKKGEIFELAGMVRPKIGILTGISNQHESLFGGVHNTIEAKYELIESLPKDGLALFNGNNSIVKKLYAKTKKNKVLYFTDYENKRSAEADIVAFNIKSHKLFITFDVMLKTWKQPKRYKANILGKHMIENILPAIYLALYLKVPSDLIDKGIRNIRPQKSTMEPHILEKGAILIDDTFNASIESVHAALSYISLFQGKKIFIFHPLIELGRDARALHRELGEKIGRICDTLITTNNNYKRELLDGVIATKHNCKVMNFSVQNVATYLKSLHKEDVVILEGKEASVILPYINHETVY